MAKRILLLASGAGSLAEAVMDARIEGIEIIALISDREAPVLERAQERGIKNILISYKDAPSRDEWNKKIIEITHSLAPDLVLSLGFMRILPPEFVNTFPTINTHPALLPKYPGAHAVRDALADGATLTGSTVHWVDEGMDTGEVIKQVSVEVLSSDTEESLHERIKIEERKLIVEVLSHYSQNKIKSGLMK